MGGWTQSSSQASGSSLRQGRQAKIVCYKPSGLDGQANSILTVILKEDYQNKVDQDVTLQKTWYVATSNTSRL